MFFLRRFFFSLSFFFLACEFIIQSVVQIRGTVSEISDTKDEIGFHKTFRVSNEKDQENKIESR